METTTNIHPQEMSELSFQRWITSLDWLSSILLKVTIDGEVNAVKEILRERPTSIVAASNHLGEVETVVLPLNLILMMKELYPDNWYAHRFHPVSKPGNFHLGSKYESHDSFIGKMFRRLGVYEINRSYVQKNGRLEQDKDAKHLLPIAEAVNQGNNIYFCPQGHRGKIGVSGGLGYILSNTSVPTTIIPVNIEGNCRLSPSLLLPRGRTLTFTFGAPYIFSLKKYELAFKQRYHDLLLESLEQEWSGRRFNMTLPTSGDLDDRILTFESRLNRMQKTTSSIDYAHADMRSSNHWTLYEEVYKKMSLDTITV